MIRHRTAHPFHENQCDKGILPNLSQLDYIFEYWDNQREPGAILQKRAVKYTDDGQYGQLTVFS
jgi:hypothetical protein